MSTTNTDQGFKLLAIRPLPGCDKKYCKNLQPGQVYQFYQDYKFEPEFDDKGNKPMKVIPLQSSVPKDLYSIKRDGKPDLNINISALVGKNGSGKSTLIELLFAASHNLSIQKNVLKNSDLPHEETTSLTSLNNLHLEIYYSIKGNVYSLIIENDKHFFKIIHPVNSEVVNFKIDTVLDDHLGILGEGFFYTIAVNYSIYGLNDGEIGKWINPLFHKNDGYQTPLVINPMRTNGDFNINDEKHLMKSRLLANLISDPTTKLSDKQVLDRIELTLNLEKSNVIYREGVDVLIDKEHFFKDYDRTKSLEENKNAVYGIIRSHYGLSAEVNSIEISVFEYIIRKLYKIAYKYSYYRRYLVRDGMTPFFQSKGEFSFEKYLADLSEDHSHITFKLRQAVNFLKYKWVEHLEKDAKESSKQVVFDFPLVKMIEIIDEIKEASEENAINLLPPSLFESKFLLKPINEKESHSDMVHLSSGELQRLSVIHSILYHLRNIDSVFSQNAKSKKGEQSIMYSNVQIILDEIELYFHPDFQRSFIKELLSGIENLELGLCTYTPSGERETFIGIESINILFATHSPFILSDIPSPNILRLKNGIPYDEPEQGTFGANLYDMLHDNFFLEGGFMGKFAEEKINSLINFLTMEENISSNWDMDRASRIIQLIGEPYLKQDMISLLQTKERKLTAKMTDEEIDKEIERLIFLKRHRR